MDRKDLEKRTKEFALRIIKFVANLSKNRINSILGGQLLRSGTSIGANYREANHAASRKDFVHKINIVEKECGESQYWLEIFDESDIGDCEERHWLLRECGELTAIFISIGKSAKGRK